MGSNADRALEDAADAVRAALLNFARIARDDPRPTGLSLVAAANSQALPKKYLTSKELAKALGKSTRTIANWREQGVPSERVGHDFRYVLADVKEWIRQRNQKDE
jgi:predicted DNA-binding transcriptional regulator AlpA